jgi:hypothetical protein
VLDRRQGEAEEVQRDVVDFTASSMGPGGRLRRRTEAAAELCCPAAAERRAAAARVLGIRPGVVAPTYKGPGATIGVRATPRRRRRRARPGLPESNTGTARG